jgi:Rod binding domain-containing protein
MAASLSIPTNSMSAIDALTAGNSASVKLAAGKANGTAKAWKASQDFEQVFLNNMFQQMFTSTSGEGPVGGQGAGGVWRSYLTDEYAKNFTKAGGIGIAKQVYSTLLAQQEVAK